VIEKLKKAQYAVEANGDKAVALLEQIEECFWNNNIEMCFQAVVEIVHMHNNAT